MKALETMEERCKSLTSGFRHTSLKWKKNLCPGQDSNLHLPAILVGHDIHYTCGNFIDVSRSNAVNPRDIFHLYPIIIYYYYHYYYCYYYYYYPFLYIMLCIHVSRKLKQRMKQRIFFSFNFFICHIFIILQKFYMINRKEKLNGKET